MQRFSIFAHPYIINLANFLNIEMGPTTFERKSFVSVCTSLTFIYTSKSSEIVFQNFENIPKDYVSLSPDPLRTNESKKNTNRYNNSLSNAHFDILKIG